jgi:hypothetical protein
VFETSVTGHLAIRTNVSALFEVLSVGIVGTSDLTYSSHHDSQRNKI